MSKELDTIKELRESLKEALEYIDAFEITIGKLGNVVEDAVWENLPDVSFDYNIAKKVLEKSGELHE